MNDVDRKVRNMRYWAKLEQMNACPAAVEWCRSYGTLQKAWDVCKRGDWMLWLCARVGLDEERHKAIVLAACDIAELGKKYWRPEIITALECCLETARAWARGETGLDEVNATTRATHDAAYATYAAAYATSDAAHAANAATHAANAATHAATAYSAAASTVVGGSLKQCADIVRGYLSCPNLDRRRSR